MGETPGIRCRVSGAEQGGQGMGNRVWGPPGAGYREVFAMGTCVGEILARPAGEDRKSLGAHEERAY